MIKTAGRSRSSRLDWKAKLALAVPLAWLLYVHIRADITMWRVEHGMPRHEVIKRLGVPDKIEATLIFCDGYFDWSGACPTTVYPEYLFFRRGIDRWVVLGLDRNQRVSFKTVGEI